jgi:argininosuccinate lyase
MIMMHLSRFSEEIILWSSNEFGFVDLDDAYSTGSSIMPQKKNPDVAELIRGKTGRVYGDLMGLLTMMKGIPLAYNKDMQEDKEQIFDAVDTVKLCIPVFCDMIMTMTVKTDNMLKGAKGGFTNATDVADYLVKKGLPFRDAHHVVGRLVLHCEQNACAISGITLEKLGEFCELFADDVYDEMSESTCVAKRNIIGGTAPEIAKEHIKKIKEFIK